MMDRNKIVALHSAVSKKELKKAPEVRPDKEFLMEARASLDIIDGTDRLVSMMQKRIEKIQKGQAPKAKAKTKKTYAVCFGILGFCLGVALAGSEILLRIGALDTLLKTMAAFAVSLLSGALICKIFAWAGQKSAESLIASQALKVRDLQEKINEQEETRIEEIDLAIDFLNKAKNIGIKSRYGK